MTALHLVAHPEFASSPAKLVDVRLIDLLVERPEHMPALSRSEGTDLALALAEATSDLLEGSAGRMSVQFDANREIWECGLERCGTDVLVSLYRPSPSPRVVTHERRLALSELLGR